MCYVCFRMSHCSGCLFVFSPSITVAKHVCGHRFWPHFPLFSCSLDAKTPHSTHINANTPIWRHTCPIWFLFVKRDVWGNFPDHGAKLDLVAVIFYLCVYFSCPFILSAQQRTHTNLFTSIRICFLLVYTVIVVVMHVYTIIHTVIKNDIDNLCIEFQFLLCIQFVLDSI